MGTWGANPDADKIPAWLSEDQKRQCIATTRGWEIPLAGSKPALRLTEVIVCIRDLINRLPNNPDAPVFTSEPILTATEEVEYTYLVTATDVDNSYEDLTFLAVTLPDWLELVDHGNGTATLSGTPSDTDFGPHDVVIQVSDGEDVAQQSFTIVVESSTPYEVFDFAFDDDNGFEIEDSEGEFDFEVRV